MSLLLFNPYNGNYIQIQEKGEKKEKRRMKSIYTTPESENKKWSRTVRSTCMHYKQ